MTAAVTHHTGTHPRLTSRTVEIDPRVDVLDHLGPAGFAWLGEEVELATAGVAAAVTPERAAALLATIDHEDGDPAAPPAAGPIAVGALPFAGGGTLAVPRRSVVVHSGRAWLTETAPGRTANDPAPRAPGTAQPRPPSRFEVTGTPDSDGWKARVDRALALIDQGVIDKLVLAREVSVAADTGFDIRSVLSFLRASQPGCTVYAHGGFVGATPELLVARHGLDVVSQPMAGSLPAGVDADDALVAGLLASVKEAVEHRLVVDAVREGLAPFCDDVRAGEPRAVRLATVTHLATTVEARVRSRSISALDLALALHPTPAVGGTPRSAAVAAIREIEGFDRGCYGGPVGWVAANGDGELGVALRCAEIDGPSARLLAGAGIVSGSDPTAEWTETQAKLEPMLRALVRP